MNRTSLVRLATLLLSTHAAFAQSRPIGITHVTVIDVEHGRRLRDQTVIIEGERIATVGPSDQVRVPDGYGIVEARGKFVIPGLIDTHAHLTGTASVARSPDEIARRLARLVLLGVTGVAETTVGGVDSATVMMRVAREPTNAPISRVRWLTTVSEGGGGSSGMDSGGADGSAIHGELRRAVASGLTPAAALRAATFDAAGMLGWQKRLGTVAPAKLADLLILDGNPLDDIGNTERIAALVFGGRLIDGTERNVLLLRMGVR